MAGGRSPFTTVIDWLRHRGGGAGHVRSTDAGSLPERNISPSVGAKTHLLIGFEQLFCGNTRYRDT
jgi:hypothetical protein